MATVELQIPDELAQAAQREGLFAPEVIVALLEDAIRRCAGRRLIELTHPATRVASAMSEKDVQAFVQSEIDDYRIGN